MKEKVWYTLVNLKYKSYIIDLNLEKNQNLERKINIFLAIASSGSIAGWTIWKNTPMIWGAIIAFSQFITVVIPYFRLNKNARDFKQISYHLDHLNFKFELLWNDVQENLIEEDEIRRIYVELKEAAINILNLDEEIILDKSKKICDKADERMVCFLQNEYQITVKLNQ